MKTSIRNSSLQLGVASIFVCGLFSGCGYHESRALYAAEQAKPSDLRGLTESEEIQFEIQQGLVSNLSNRLDQGLSVDTRLSKGKTLVMEAAVWRKIQIVRVLIDRGADLALLDQDGKSVRDYAFGNPEILRLLPATLDPLLVERLFQLVDVSDYRKLKGELDLGVDPNLKNLEGDTLLIRAVRKSSRSVVSTLLRYPGVRLSDRDLSGKTALALARDLGHSQIEKELLARGATE